MFKLNSSFIIGVIMTEIIREGLGLILQLNKNLYFRQMENLSLLPETTMERTIKVLQEEMKTYK